MKYQIENNWKLVSAQLTAGHNNGLTKYQIDNNWKLEDWNDKIES